MKRLLCWALALCMALSLLPIGTRAADVVDSGKCGDNLTYTLYSDGKLEISGTGAMQDYRGVNSTPWGTDIKEVVIKEGVTEIGTWAFTACEAMTSASLPKSLKVIRDRAFGSCEQLPAIVLPSGLTSIGEYAFSGCDDLREISLPNSVQSVGKCAFASCDAIENVTLGTCPSIGEEAFGGLKNVRTIDLGKNTLDFWSVFGFEGKLTYTSRSALGKLESIKVSSDNGIYSVKDGTLFSKDGKTLIFHPAGLQEAYTVPETVTRIGDYGFCNSKAKEIRIGSSVTAVAYGAFLRATGLQRLELPDSVQSLGAKAMRDCTWLEHVVLSEGLKTISNGVFWDDTDMTTLYIPSSVTAIEENAFFVNQYVTPPETDVYFGGTEAQWKAIKGVDEVPDTYHIHFNHTHSWDDGTVTKAAAVGVAGEKVFQCKDCTKSKVETIPALPEKQPEKVKLSFTDVKDSDYFAEAVAWAVEKGVTDGTTDTTFSPAADCTRGQMVTFLWRAAECPEPTKTDNPFTDVQESDYFYKAVLWAVEKGITDGTSDTTFSPDATCTRAHVVTFLWRVENKPAPGDKNPFTDVSAGEWYSEAVLWAVAKAITDGTSDTTFSPADSCTRGQIVTFLWRDMQ